jgi:hypothetical protein
VANTLRWRWRRSRLNHDDPEGWQRALAAAKKRAAKIGEPPDGYAYEPPSPTPPNDPRIKRVERRASAFEAASRNPVTDRSTRTKQRRQKMIAPKTPQNFDWKLFFSHHWRDTFWYLWKAYGLSDADAAGDLARVVAVTYRDKLDEQNTNGGTIGQASRRWDQLLRDLRQGVRPGHAPSTPHQVPPIAPSSPSRLVGAPDNDAWLRELFDEVLEREQRERSRGV